MVTYTGHQNCCVRSHNAKESFQVEYWRRLITVAEIVEKAEGSHRRKSGKQP